ncbi:hypothetical protein DYQ86_04820 [Acidobacteria bacterium AB60]|nr:hypothetical protein DYQ86_04820 [Acidobacteria bacterium AB60]
MVNVSSPSVDRSLYSNREALAIAAQARALSGNKLEQLVVRLQRHTGQSKALCWRFVIQYGLKGRSDHRRWTNEELETLREGLVKFSLEEMATKLHRSPRALRQKLAREGYNLRDIRCDLFSVDGLACAIKVQRTQVLSWIALGWLPATATIRCNRKYYIITPEALSYLYKNHLQDVLKRGVPNQSLFEAYVQYCHSPKHTVGEQLLDVRRDKRERAAYEQLRRESENSEETGDNHDVDEEQDAEPESRYGIAV